MKLKKAGAVLAAAAAIVGTTVLAAPAAGAATPSYGCSGSRIDSYPVLAPDAGRTVFGTAYLYYDASTHTNCAVTVANSAGGYGRTKAMQIWLAECAETVAGAHCHPVHTQIRLDSGDYKYYAGPVSVSAGHHCVQLIGEIDWQGLDATAITAPGHCG